MSRSHLNKINCVIRTTKIRKLSDPIALLLKIAHKNIENKYITISHFSFHIPKHYLNLSDFHGFFSQSIKNIHRISIFCRNRRDRNFDTQSTSAFEPHWNKSSENVKKRM